MWFSKIQGDKKSKYILLLDEPGLSLHASAQKDLLRFIDEKLAPEYQVIYTTHSPFMIDSLKLNEVRTVYDTQDSKIGTLLYSPDRSMCVLRSRQLGQSNDQAVLRHFVSCMCDTVQ